MSILKTDKFSPTVFIGLGGSGGKVVNRLMQKLKRHRIGTASKAWFVQPAWIPIK